MDKPKYKFSIRASYSRCYPKYEHFTEFYYDYEKACIRLKQISEVFDRQAQHAKLDDYQIEMTMTLN